YGIRYIALGAYYEPVMTVVALGRAYRQDPGERGPSVAALRRSWFEARPEIEVLATQKIVSSILPGTLHLAALAVVGLGMIAVSRREVLRVARASRPTDTEQ